MSSESIPMEVLPAQGAGPASDCAVAAAAPAPDPAGAIEASKVEPPKRKGIPKAPPGYKIVKYRKDDGTECYAKKKLAPDELAAATNKPIEGTAARSAEATAGATQAADEGASATKAPLKAKKTKAAPTKAADGATARKAAKGGAESQGSKAQSNSKPDAEAAARGPPEEVNGGAAALSQEEVQRALEKQQQQFREKRLHRFKQSFLTGALRIAGSAIPALEISGHHGDSHHGDGDDDGDDGDLDSLSDFDHDDDDHHGGGGGGGDEHHDGADDHDHGDRDLDTDDPHHGDEKEDIFKINTGAAAKAAGVAGVAGLAASARNAEKQPPPPTAAAAAPGAKDKVTYKITEKDLEAMDNQAAEKASHTLSRHWTNFAFYFMASLSIILPLLFLILGVFIVLADNKPATNSQWAAMPEVIKVATTAWPIIFAAVIAQLLKTWATYRVERGMKLMELEQLVGSSSFAAAAKQPFVLRSIDLLTLTLFVVWCLSPVGSSALQRTLTITSDMTAPVNTTVYYLDNTGENRLLSTINFGESIHLGTNTAALQNVSTLYQRLFTRSLLDTDDMDDWNHPRVAWVENTVDGYYPSAWPPSVSHAGIPVVLTDSIFASDNDVSGSDSFDSMPSESTDFTIRASYFTFQCKNWTVINGTVLDEVRQPSSGLPWSIGPTNSTWYSFYSDNPNSPDAINRMTFTSVIHHGRTAKIGADALELAGPNSRHSTIDCGFRQRYFNVDVNCNLSPLNPVNVPACSAEAARIREVQASDFGSNVGAQLGQSVQDPFARYTGPPDVLGSFDVTPNEHYLGFGEDPGLVTTPFDPDYFNLSALVTPDVFEARMAYLFNTFVDLANSASYFYYYQKSDFQEGDINPGTFATIKDAQWSHTESIFALQRIYAALFLVCAGLLFIGGVASVVVETRTVAPDVLGYVSTVVRNSRYLKLPKTKTAKMHSAMNGAQRARALRDTVVMMQDVKAESDVGRIALGIKTEEAQRLRHDRMYR